MRIYDPRLGKFLSTDPIAKKYPELTPYQFASNRPIDGIDLDGLEFFKKDNTNYILDYYPVLKAPDFKTGLQNAILNGGNFLSNVTVGALSEGSKSVNNYFAGGYKEPASNGDPLFEFNQWSEHITHTPIKEQLKDLGNGLTDLKNYELPAQILITHKFSLVQSSLATDVSASKALVSQEKLLYRFDTRSLDEITKSGGFNSPGYDMNLLEHANGNNIFNKTSGFVSTSSSLKAVDKFAKGKTGFIYTIADQSNGFNVNKILRKGSPFPAEKEIAVPLRIPASDIKSVKKVGG